MASTAFARNVFRWAGIYGIVALVPQYFMEAKIGADFPPAITHPEYFYGFLGVALAWQIAFLIIAKDPVRYRALMIPSALEKFAFAAAATVLFLSARAPALVFGLGLIDFVLGVLFLVVWRRGTR